jgi:hypothetical protein
MRIFSDKRSDDNVFDLRSEYSVNSRNYSLNVADLKNGIHELTIENLDLRQKLDRH